MQVVFLYHFRLLDLVLNFNLAATHDPFLSPAHQVYQRVGRLYSLDERDVPQTKYIT